MYACSSISDLKHNENTAFGVHSVKYKSYTVKSNILYFINDRDSPDATINWLAHFDGILPDVTGQNVKRYIRESQPKVIQSDAYVIKIGNNSVYYLPYITTDVVSEKMLLNFTYSTELEDRSLARFLSLQTSFCNMVRSCGEAIWLAIQ